MGGFPIKMSVRMSFEATEEGHPQATTLVNSAFALSAGSRSRHLGQLGCYIQGKPGLSTKSRRFNPTQVKNKPHCQSKRAQIVVFYLLIHVDTIQAHSYRFLYCAPQTNARSPFLNPAAAATAKRSKHQSNPFTRQQNKQEVYGITL